jgi:hypothetical protein
VTLAKRDTYRPVLQRPTALGERASDKWVMNPFITVFRIRLLLLAAALVLMGVGTAKKDQQAKSSASNAKPTLSHEAATGTRKSQARVLVVQRR